MSSIRDFVPLTKLGQGTFSTVYKVRRLSDQKIYALKKVRMNNLSQKQKENALNQIRILASFDCNNIVAYKQAFFDQKLNVLCIVMQFADGGDLHKYITDTKKDFRKVSQIIIWKIAADILLALEHLHNKGILHRDLKSANIFVHGDQYKLGDLNVSKVNGGKLAYTQTGTPYYASPEVWRDQPYDSKSDIWSFGCILYQLTCLRPPFYGKDMDQLFKNVQKSGYQPIPQQYSLQLAEVIDQCLQKNPKNRPKASKLLQHPVILRFKNRKNTPIDETNTQKQLLRTIKLPSDLKSLKQNLPQSKYQDKKQLQVKENRFLNQKYDIKNIISDRPYYINKSAVIQPSNLIQKNNSQVVNINKPQSPKINQSEVFLSPKNIKKVYEYHSLNKSPEQLLNKKIASAHISNSDKKPTSININAYDYTDRKYRNQPQQNYSDRKIVSQKKTTIIDKYDRFIEQQLNKKPLAMPRTQKRISSSQQGRSQNQNPCVHIPQTPVGADKKDVQQWKKKLVKKSRVFSNNIFQNRPIYGNKSQLR